jgi:H+/gluconate symporter-like permease
MRCNVGKKEAALRALIAGLIFAVGIYWDSWWGLIGLIPLATAVFRWCPLSAALGFSSCKTEPKQ